MCGAGRINKTFISSWRFAKKHLKNMWVFKIAPLYFHNFSVFCINCWRIQEEIPLEHSVHWGINSSPQKHYPLFLAKPPLLKSANRPSPPFLGNPPYILVFHEPPPKNQIFQWTPKILKFFIINPILSFKSN